MKTYREFNEAFVGSFKPSDDDKKNSIPANVKRPQQKALPPGKSSGALVKTNNNRPNNTTRELSLIHI